MTDIRRFCFPATAREAARLAARLKGRAAVVAGGTRLVRTLPPAVETVIDISDLPLRGIRAEKSRLRIGALCTIKDLECCPLLAKWAGGLLSRTAGFGSNAMARGMGTLGGNIVRPHPFNHLPPALLALDARLRATDGTRERVLSFADTLEKGFPPGLLLTEVLLGADTRGLRTAAGRLAPTRTSWESAASCAVALEIRGGRCERAAIAVGAVLQRAARMGRAEKALEGRPLDEASARGAEREVLAELARSLDREDPGYRVEAAGVLVRRAIIEILGESR